MGKVEIHARDLAAQPVLANELAPFTGLWCSTRRMPARRRKSRTSPAKVPTVIYVSCDPIALGRDARVLRDAGDPVGVGDADRSVWSARSEAVACSASRATRPRPIRL